MIASAHETKEALPRSGITPLVRWRNYQAQTTRRGPAQRRWRAGIIAIAHVTTTKKSGECGTVWYRSHGSIIAVQQIDGMPNAKGLIMHERCSCF